MNVLTWRRVVARLVLWSCLLAAGYQVYLNVGLVHESETITQARAGC
jgi:hypothetical protein